MMSNRPIGITFLALAYFLMGVLFLSSVFAVSLIQLFFPVFVIVINLFSVPSWFFTIFCIAMGAGLFALKSWAWWGVIVIEALGILTALWYSGSKEVDLSIGLITNIIMLGYMIYVKGSFSGSELG